MLPLVAPLVNGHSDLAIGSRLAPGARTVRGNRLVVIELRVGGLVLVVLAVVATATVRLGLRPLIRIEQTAGAIASGRLERRVEEQDPRTETGRLSAALNTMLTRLVDAVKQREQSEQRLRRFVADASHELRAPLTSIRGFTELYRRSETHREADVRMMMGRIEAEAVRMGGDRSRGCRWAGSGRSRSRTARR